MVTEQHEAVGLEAVRIALDEIAARDPEFRQHLRVDKTGRSAQTGGSAQWCVAYQLGKVTNEADTTDTPVPRVAAQLTIQHRNSEEILFTLGRHREEIERAMGHRLSWLPGGEAGGKLRSIVRSWREMDADAETLGRWMAEELLRLREALHPGLDEIDLDAP